MRVTRAGPSEDLSALSYPLVAHPLYPECCRTGPVQGLVGNLAILLEVIPEHRRPLSRLDGHAQVGEGCEASDKTGEIEHHCGNPAAAVTVGNRILEYRIGQDPNIYQAQHLYRLQTPNTSCQKSCMMQG